MDEDPKGFMDEVLKVVDSMGVSNHKKTSYKLQDVAQVLDEHWKGERIVGQR